MVDALEFARWRQAAEDTRRAAGVQGDAGIHNWACFLAEQAAQLALKGVLHGIGARAWGHDPVALGGVLADNMARPLHPDVQAALRRLSRHYIPARYPDARPSGPPALYYGAADVTRRWPISASFTGSSTPSGVNSMLKMNPAPSRA